MHIGDVQKAKAMSDDRPEAAKRLESARVKRGFATAKDAARYFGWVYETYIQHEQGIRGIGRQSKKYADAFRVSEAWLLTGEGMGLDGQRMIPVVGLVGAGAEIHAIDDHAKGAGLDEVECPWDQLGPDTVAVRVRGDSMLPVFHDGDLIFYESISADFTHLLGRDCVVGLADGRRFVKQLRRTADGHFYLHSHNSEPIFGVAISWAAKIRLLWRAN